MSLIPVFYGMALVILFFLIYYASKLQMERRKHEFGVYLMMGMRRSKLFVMLLAEDLQNSMIVLAVGLPVSFVLSELISLITARLVGIGIVGHQISFSIQAILWMAGTMAFFWGLRFPIGLLVKAGKRDRKLHVFHFRQIEETVIYQSGTLAVCSLLILAALCCFGSGMAITVFYGESEPHVLDYTFAYVESNEEVEAIRQNLTDHGLDSRFSDLFEMKIGSFNSMEEADTINS